MVDLKAIGVGIVVLLVVVSIGAKITFTVRETLKNETTYDCNNASAPLGSCEESEAWKATYSGENALGDFADWAPIIIITGIGGAILLMIKIF